MSLKHEIPYYLDISRSSKFSIEILDDLINQLFDFHFIVPVAEFDTVLKVKPSFNKLSWPLPGASTGRSYSKDWGDGT